MSDKELMDWLRTDTDMAVHMIDQAVERGEVDVFNFDLRKAIRAGWNVYAGSVEGAA